MRATILSPHRDDAAFSCGLTMQALLEAGAAITVVNIFTRSDYAVDLRTVDPALPRVDAVSAARRLEDEQFVADLARSAGCQPGSLRLVDLGWTDAPLRLSVRTEQVLQAPLPDAEVQREAEALATQLAFLHGDSLVFCPLALGDHIDHRVVREAAKLAASAEQLCFYEDLPYAARLAPELRKEQAIRATRSNQRADIRRHALSLPHGAHLKKRFATQYPSQIALEVADEMALYAAHGTDGQAGAERWWALPETAARVSALLAPAPVQCNLAEETQ